MTAGRVPPGPEGVVRQRVESQKTVVWRRFRRNVPGMIGLALLVTLVLIAVFIPALVPYDRAIEQDLPSALQGPSLAHPLGVDDLGRDMLARILWGSRLSLTAGAVAVTIALTLGTFLGAASGFYGGGVDTLISRTVDVILAVPSILLALAIVSTQGAGIVNVMVAVGIAAVPAYARLVRSIVLGIRELDFVLAARCFGLSDPDIIRRHIIPNAVGPIVVRATVGVSEAILATAALGFLGLGPQPPTPEWGSMLSGARVYVSTAPFVVAVPGLAIAVTVLAFNIAGDALRDALDPFTHVRET